MDDVQQLTLTGKTVITGDVVFKSGNGEVVLNNGAVIKGKVIGGKTVTSK